MSKLAEMTKTYPQTELWNDSCSYKELSYSVERGATGATTNPVIVFNVLKKELPEWEDTIRKLVANASKLLLDKYKASNGQLGRISFQTNAKFYQNCEKMVEQACDLAATVENSQIKVPASKAGIKAIEELTYRGVSVNATVSFTVAQALAVAEAVERGLKRRSEEGLDSSTLLQPMNMDITLQLFDIFQFFKGFKSIKEVQP